MPGVIVLVGIVAVGAYVAMGAEWRRRFWERGL